MISHTDRSTRPCRYRPENRALAEVYCIFCTDDDTGYEPYCDCESSLYNSMEDRRDRPCKYNLYRHEAIKLIDDGVV